MTEWMPRLLTLGGVSLAAAYAVVAQAQAPLHVQARLLQKGKATPIVDASVVDLPKRSTATQTGADGSFSFDVPADAEAILITAPGFEELSVRIQNGKLADEGPFLLEPSVETVGMGIIRARRKSEISQQMLQRDDVARLPGTGQDPVRALQALPSVLPVFPGSADIVVRGSGPGDNRYFFDNLQLPFVFHLGGLGAVVPYRMLESVDLYAGGFSAIYGDATGAIVQLRSENSTPERTSGMFELGLLQSSAYLEGHFGGGKSGEDSHSLSDDEIGYRLGARRTYLELFAPIIKNSAKKNGDVSFTTLPQATDAQALFNGKHRLGTWQAYLLGVSDRLRLVAPAPNSDRTDGRSEFSLFNAYEIAGLRYNMNLGNGWGATVSPQQTYTIMDQKFFDNVVKVKSNTLSLTATLDKRVSEQLSAGIGERFFYTHYSSDVDAIQMPDAASVVFYDSDTAVRAQQHLVNDEFSGQAWVDISYRPVKEWLVNPGLIFQQGGRAQQQEWDPRLGTRYALNESWTVKGAWGMYSQRPDPAQESPEYGNPHLKMQKAIHYVAGVESKLAEDYETDLQIYFKNMYRFVGSAVEHPELKYENNIRGTAKGLEVFLRKKHQGRWHGWLGYSLARADQYDPRRKEWRPFSWDVRHSLNLVAAYRLTGRWEVGSRLNYKTGTPYTKVSGGEFNQNTGKYVPIPGQINNARNPATLDWDVRTDYDVLYDAWKLSYYLEIRNVLNRKNVVGYRRSEDFREEKAVTGTPILPAFGVVASF